MCIALYFGSAFWVLSYQIPLFGLIGKSKAKRNLEERKEGVKIASWRAL